MKKLSFLGLELEIQNLIGLGQAITQTVADVYNTTSSPNTTVPATAP